MSLSSARGAVSFDDGRSCSVSSALVIDDSVFRHLFFSFPRFDGVDKVVPQWLCVGADSLKSKVPVLVGISAVSAMHEGSRYEVARKYVSIACLLGGRRRKEFYLGPDPLRACV